MPPPYAVISSTPTGMAGQDLPFHDRLIQVGDALCRRYDRGDCRDHGIEPDEVISVMAVVVVTATTQSSANFHEGSFCSVIPA